MTIEITALALEPSRRHKLNLIKNYIKFLFIFFIFKLNFLNKY